MATSIQIVQTLMKKIQALPRERIAEVEDFVDFLKTRAKRRKITAVGKSPLDFPVDDLGPWPESLSLHREELYGDDGR